jgi:hypothetical protein
MVTIDKIRSEPLDELRRGSLLRCQRASSRYRES